MSSTSPGLIILVSLAAACTGGGRDRGSKPGALPSQDSDSGVDTSCADGQIQCDGKDKLVCENNVYSVVETCADGCTAGLGCTSCSPSEASCDGDVSTYCSGDGSEIRHEVCDAVKGLTCSAATGRCEGACSEAALGRSYVGCEYYAIQTSNNELPQSRFNFAVAIANTSELGGKVTISGGGLSSPRTLELPADGVLVEKLPWVSELQRGEAVAVTGGAYRVRSTVPVTAYQFNPLEYNDGQGSSFGNYSYTNDASLLLPTNAMDDSYRVLGWPAWDAGAFNPTSPSIVAVVATQDGTELTFETPPSGTAVTPSNYQSLDAGDIIQIVSEGDLSGSLLEANAPIAVLSAHNCTNVPMQTTACDHLEESVLPTSSTGKKYVVAAPALPSLPSGKVRVVRIQAMEPDTTLTYSEDVGGAAAIPGAGDFIELSLTDKDFVIEANKPIQVAQFMAGQSAGGGAGDPAMTVAIPVEQYRAEYLIHAPTNYATNYVNIVRPAGTSVAIDGAAVEGFTAVGDGSYEVARHELANTGNGNHRIEADQAVGVSVYGYGDYTSYWYPGGLDLERIGPR